eukprot:6313150-Prymnesium_polylepis.1
MLMCRQTSRASARSSSDMKKRRSSCSLIMRSIIGSLRSDGGFSSTRTTVSTGSTAALPMSERCLLIG